MAAGVLVTTSVDTLRFLGNLFDTEGFDILFDWAVHVRGAGSKVWRKAMEVYELINNNGGNRTRLKSQQQTGTCSLNVSEQKISDCRKGGFQRAFEMVRQRSGGGGKLDGR